MVIMNENGGTRLSLSTKALEPQAGDMLRNPGLVYEKAEEMAALFRERTQVGLTCMTQKKNCQKPTENK